MQIDFPFSLHTLIRRHQEGLGTGVLTRFLVYSFLAIVLMSSPCRATDTPGPELRIASEGARPPYNYLENNELAGFEIDLGQELCKRMNRVCRFVPQDWDNLIPGLLDHRYDAIMAALDISDAAKEKIAFSEPYVRMPMALLGNREEKLPDTSPKGLTGKKLGVEANSLYQAYAEDHFDHSQIQTYASLEEAILDLGEGRIDLVLGNKADISDFLKNRREAQNTAILGELPHDAAYLGEGIGIGLRKEDKELKRQFDQALEDINKDGTFTKIRERYFPYAIN
ncbi:transporter substrate-binding domain-containing protein [Beijerinckia indica]|uniref:Extracellular solute-binding protein family 3 n=1 Tax=Beijerinckia indica subsp. indica (strain ATCC 9039 / DSM 1715 / NCIMB 8712) TaxID=395963 RepID=B2IDH9_BEII9|nr:transporter substrate-binding domain-containing protein [Beijerinckia indica]ACB95415.1 extracellular solute-binding protein family 3 [Beijerinckia indica subsp. indica ATCC 9039]